MIHSKTTRLSVIALMATGLSSWARAQDVVTLPSVTFNDPVAAGGAPNPANVTYTATASTSYILGTIAQAASGAITRSNVNASTTSFGFRLTNSSYPSLFGDFSLSTGTFAANVGTLGASTRLITGTLASVNVVSGSTWTFEAFASVTAGASVGAAEGTAVDVSLTLNAVAFTNTVRETFTYSGTPVDLAFSATTTSGTGFTAAATANYVLQGPTLTPTITLTGVAATTLPGHVRVTAYNSGYPGFFATWRPWNNTATLANWSAATGTARTFSGIGGSISGSLLNAPISSGSTWTFIFDEATDDAPTSAFDTTLSALSFSLTGVDLPPAYTYDTGLLAGPFNAGGAPFSPDNAVVTGPAVGTAFIMGTSHFIQAVASQVLTSSASADLRIRVRNSAYPTFWTLELNPGFLTFSGGSSGVVNPFLASPSPNTTSTFRAQNTLRGLNIPAGSTFSFEFWDATDNGPGADAVFSNVRVQFNSGAAAGTGTPPGTVTSLGGLDPAWASTTSALSSAVGALAAGEVKWYSFDVPVGATGTLGRYINIWTTGSNDLMLGLWDPTGRLIGYDDDSGLSLNSALSFGTPTATAYTTSSTDVANNGRDGDGLSPGTYYLSVSRFASPRVFEDGFVHTNSGLSSAAGSTLRIMTNVPAAPPDQAITLPLNFAGAVNPFAVNRAMRYTVVQGTTTLVSTTTFTATNASQSVVINVPGSASGAATIEIDGAQYLKRKVTVTLTGSAQTLPAANLLAGDVDNSTEVDLTDIDLIIGDYLGTGGTTEGTITDLDNSGEVDLTDIDIAIGNYLLADD